MALWGRNAIGEPEPHKTKAPQKSITITPDADTLAWIEAQAKADGRSLSNWLAWTVKQMQGKTDAPVLPFVFPEANSAKGGE